MGTRRRENGRKITPIQKKEYIYIPIARVLSKSMQFSLN